MQSARKRGDKLRNRPLTRSLLLSISDLHGTWSMAAGLERKSRFGHVEDVGGGRVGQRHQRQVKHCLWAGPGLLIMSVGVGRRPGAVVDVQPVMGTSFTDPQHSSSWKHKCGNCCP